MKRTIISICALLALVSCQSLKEEWQPVFTFDANEPAEFVPVTETELMSRYHFTEFTTIQALKAMYKSPTVPAASTSRSASLRSIAITNSASGYMSAAPASRSVRITECLSWAWSRTILRPMSMRRPI